MKVGVVSRMIWDLDNEGTAEFLAERGFTSTELCFTATDSKYWAYNGRSDISGLTCAKVSAIAEAYRGRGIYVASLGVYTDLFKGEASEVDANLEYFKRHMDFAAYCGIPAVASECGFRPEGRGVQAKTYEGDFDALKASLSRLLEHSEKTGVDVALECCVLDVVPSAKRARDLIAQLGSDHMKVVLDPANLLANSSEEDMFRYLTPHVSYFHGKDRKVNAAYGVNVGDGDVDWPLFLALYHRHTEGVPFILEYCNKDNCSEIRRRVLDYDAQSSSVRL
ncbi:MAG: sugar phosphate isomerase/epimerase [Oscillospiraceae bacterium]|nr:sugar phosphate isomerase/epimerase [Oscillospiraceae bacterium]